MYKLHQLNSTIKDAVHFSKHICGSEIEDKEFAAGVWSIVQDLEKIQLKLEKQIQKNQHENDNKSNAWDVIV
jgi:hypothetical protein